MMPTRKDTIDEEELLLQDVDKKKSNRNRRVKIDSYNSDSSENEAEDNQEQPDKNKKDNKVGHNDDDDDMFASDKEDEEKEATHDPKKNKLKNIKLLDMNQFEKHLYSDDELELPQVEKEDVQMYGDQDEGNEEEVKISIEELHNYYNNQEDLETLNESDRVKIKKTKGPKIEAFNLKKESKKGVFDEFGNYIRKNQESDSEEDDDDVEEDGDEDENKKVNNKDSWLTGISKSDIQKAKESEELRRRKQQEQFQATRLKNLSIKKKDLLSRIIDELEPVETPIELMKRLNNQINKFRKLKQFDEFKTLKQKIKEIMDDIELLGERDLNVYEMEKEILIREFSRISGDEYAGNSKSKKRSREEEEDGEEVQNDTVTQWEYKWLNDLDNVYGPFDASTMNEWKETYFIENPAIARKFKSDDDEFVDVFQIDFNP